MRVLVATDTYPPDINGVAGTVCTLAGGLVGLGHEVRVVTTVDAPAGGVRREQRHVVRSLPLPGYPGLRVGLTTTAHMLGVITDFQPAVIYSATETLLGIATLRAARRLGVPVVSGFHTNFQFYLQEYHLPGLEEVAAAFLRTIHNQAVRTLTPSADSAQRLRQWGVANVGVLGRGVDAALFNPARRDPGLRATWGADDRTPVALYVGRIAPEKNLALLARAFATFREVHPGAPCVVVGDGPRAGALRTECPNLIHAGSRRDADLARYYASADVFIFPSLTETFGNVVLESLAAGLVTVAFDYAAGRQLITSGRNGFTVPHGQTTAFLDRVRCAADRWDKGAIRLAARATAAALSWPSIIRLFERELAAAAGAVPPVDAFSSTPRKPGLPLAAARL